MFQLLMASLVEAFFVFAGRVVECGGCQAVRLIWAR
jgi:hypothetical protein